MKPTPETIEEVLADLRKALEGCDDFAFNWNRDAIEIEPPWWEPPSDPFTRHFRPSPVSTLKLTFTNYAKESAE